VRVTKSVGPFAKDMMIRRQMNMWQQHVTFTHTSTTCRFLDDRIRNVAQGVSLRVSNSTNALAIADF
jgi:hypothetical protein